MKLYKSVSSCLKLSAALIFFSLLATGIAVSGEATFDLQTGRISLSDLGVGSDLYSVNLIFNGECFSIESAAKQEQPPTDPQVVRHDQLLWEDTPHTIYEQGISWHDAVDYCANLELNGSDNWRVPTVAELETITDQSKAEPPKIVDGFTYAEGGPYWSSDGHDPYVGTPMAGNMTEAYIVDFHSGMESGYVDKNTSSVLYVRCINACTGDDCGNSPTTPDEPSDPSDTCDNTVLQTVGEPGMGTLEYARQYCRDLGGRLPTLDDMRALYDRNNGNYPEGFESVAGLWTSDFVDGQNGLWWTVYFFPEGLEMMEFMEDNDRSIMCVTDQCMD